MRKTLNSIVHLYFPQFWKRICEEEDLIRCDCLQSDNGPKDLVGLQGKPMRIYPEDMTNHRKVFLRGLQVNNKTRVTRLRDFLTIGLLLEA
jgi:hypothetical protein